MPELNELQKELRRLAAARDVVILAHNYQRPEVQDAADHTGDSLELSRIAQKDAHQVILFCGERMYAVSAMKCTPQKRITWCASFCAMRDSSRESPVWSAASWTSGRW